MRGKAGTARSHCFVRTGGCISVHDIQVAREIVGQGLQFAEVQGWAL